MLRKVVVLLLIMGIMAFTARVGEKEELASAKELNNIVSAEQGESSDWQDYIDRWWGYRLKYPRGWHIYGNDRYTYITSFKMKDDDIIPTKEQIKVGIMTWPRIIDNDPWTWEYIRRGERSEEKEIIIGGEKALSFNRKITPAGRLKARNPEVEVEKVKTFIIHHQDFTYVIDMTPFDSMYLAEFEKLLASFQFIKRSPEFIPRKESPPKGFNYFQDERLGYTFDYPDTWILRKFPSIDGGALRLKSDNKGDPYQYEHIHFELEPLDEGITKGADNSFEKLLKKHPEIHYASGGPSGLTLCKEGSVRIEKFKNRYGEEGYKVWSTLEHRGEFEATGEAFLVAYELKNPKIPEYRAIIFESGGGWIPEMLKIAGTFRRLKTGSAKLDDFVGRLSEKQQGYVRKSPGLVSIEEMLGFSALGTFFEEMGTQAGASGGRR